MKNNFLIADFSRETPEFVRVSADLENKTLKIDSFPPGNDHLKTFSKIIGTVSLPDGKQACEVFFIFGPDNVASFTEKLRGTRGNPKEPVSTNEIDSFISESVWRMFDRNKIQGARQFGVSGTDVLLADMKISGFKLDDKSPIDPIGQLGGEFGATAAQTFVKRSYFEKIAEVMPRKAKIAGVCESGAISAALIDRIVEQKNFLLAEVGQSRVNVYWNDGKKTAFNDFFDWGAERLEKICSEFFGTPREISAKIVEAYASRKFSDSLKKKIEKLWNGEMTELARGIKSAGDRLKTRNFFIDFPNLNEARNLTPDKIFSKIILLGDGTQPMKYFGFSVSDNRPIKFSHAAVIIENYFTPKEETDGTEHSTRTVCLVNYFAKRRMKWLMP